jgi:AcrR family transcriptional regulator
MNDTTLTRERILEAAEDVIRRFGLNKATVVDVAHALGVSHSSVYKHFSSKAELRDAVTKIWLARTNAPLEEIVVSDAPAAYRLRQWLLKLIAMKRSLACGDPELFATYCAIASESRDVIKMYVESLADQVTRIIKDGMDRGEFVAGDPAAKTRAVFSATTRFTNPAHASEWSDPNIDAAFDEVWDLILRGLRA